MARAPQRNLHGKLGVGSKRKLLGNELMAELLGAKPMFSQNPNGKKIWPALEDLRGEMTLMEAQLHAESGKMK